MTGAAGLIGRALVPILARDERVREVLAIDARPPDRQAGRRDGGRVRTIVRDTLDPRLASDLAGVDALVHLAFRVLDTRAAEANVEGSRRAFEAAVAGGASAIVHASSSVVYGAAPDNPVPIGEERPLRVEPPFAYPRAKVAVERLLDELAGRAPDTRVVRLRPTTTLGPGAPLLLAGRVHVGLSDHDPPLQFTWADDVAAAFAAALLTPSATGAFNVGAPGTVRLSEVAGILGVRSLRLPHRARRAAAAAMQRLRVPGALDPGFVDMARYPIVVDARRAREELGWRPELDSEAALRRYRSAA